MRATRIAAGAAAVAVAALLGAGLTGCSGSAKVETSSTPSVSASALEGDLMDMLTKGGNDPQSVTCPEDLVGEVGKTSQCEVVLSEANTVQAVLTVTKVNDTGLDYDLKPALTKEQLEKTLTDMASAESVVCDAGLEGIAGATTKCAVTRDGSTSEDTVAVKKVEGGLNMELAVN